MFLADRCHSCLSKVHSKHPLSKDGGTWDPMACRFLGLERHIHSFLAKKEKILIERKMQYVEDRAECLGLFSMLEIKT